MRKVGILIVISLLAVTGIMAAMAYNSAEITNPAALTVASTNQALVRIVPKPVDGWPSDRNDPLYVRFTDTPNTGNMDETFYVDDDGKMHINFGKGKNGQDFGLQPGSVYTWEYAFAILNNSEEDVYAKVVVDEALRPYVKVKQAKSGGNFSDEVGFLRLNNEPGRLYSVQVDLTNYSGNLSELAAILTGSIQVIAEAR